MKNLSAAEAEKLYLMVGQLIREMPTIPNGPLTHDQQKWLGQASATVDAAGDLLDTTRLEVAIQSLQGALHASSVQTIAIVLHKTLARLEMQIPVSARGGFIPAGNAFDALAALAKVLGSAKTDALIVDPYMDEKTLIEFAPSANETVAIRLLADTANVKGSLKPAAAKWSAQYGSKRPLDARLAPSRSLHDRLIIIDATTAYTLTQSLNAFATRAPASVVRVDPETGRLKIAAYADIWNAATPL